MIGFSSMVTAMVVLAAPAAGAGSPPAFPPFPVPFAANIEEGTLRCLDLKTGEERWRSRWRSEFFDQEGVRLLRSREEAKGVYGKKDRKLAWWNEAVWKAAEDWLPIESTWEFRDPQGELVERVSKTFRYADRGDAPATVRTEIRRPGRTKDRTVSVEIPVGTLGTEGLGFALRTLEFGPDLRRVFHLVTNQPKLYRMKLTYLGEETITVPAGTFRCHKIRLAPEFGFWNFLAKPFIPDTFFWHTVGEPHLWIKYQGPESAPGSPKVSLELVSFIPRELLR